MSASREKQNRQQRAAEGFVAPKTAREAQQRQEERRSAILYGAIGAVFVIVVIASVIWNSNIISRSAAAVTVDGEKYNAGQVSFYYRNAYASFVNQWSYLVSYLGLDTSSPLDSQTISESAAGMLDAEEGITWKEYFLDSALKQIAAVQNGLKQAQEEGFSFPESVQAQFDDNIESLTSNARATGNSVGRYLQGIYGSSITERVYRTEMLRTLQYDAYCAAYEDGLTYTDEEIQAAYAEDSNSYDLVSYEAVTFDGSVPEEEETAEDAETTEDAETAEDAAAPEDAETAEDAAAPESGESAEGETPEEAASSEGEGVAITEEETPTAEAPDAAAPAEAPADAAAPAEEPADAAPAEAPADAAPAEEPADAAPAEAPADAAPAEEPADAAASAEEPVDAAPAGEEETAEETDAAPADGETAEAAEETEEAAEDTPSPEEEAAMAAARQQAEAAVAAYRAGADLTALSAEMEGASHTENDAMTYSGDALTEWLFDSARQEGDAAVVESGTTVYAVVFRNRYRDEEATVNVRHVLVSPEDGTLGEEDEGYQEEQDALLAAAKEKADQLYADWQAGEATEDTFAALAVAESEDTGSRYDGGLIARISRNDSLVQSFLDWCFADGRTAGDSGIIESTYGYHIMYFVGEDMPVWQKQVTDHLRSEAYNEWVSSLSDEAEITRADFGMRFVG